MFTFFKKKLLLYNHERCLLMENSNKIIGNKIREIRLSKGETMEEFGKRFNTSKGTVNNWEKGRNKPNRTNMLKIAQLGGLTIGELMGFHVTLTPNTEEKIKGYRERQKRRVERFNEILDDNFKDFSLDEQVDQFMSIKDNYNNVYGNILRYVSYKNITGELSDDELKKLIPVTDFLKRHTDDYQVFVDIVNKHTSTENPTPTNND